jgi:hypothetical protein
MIDFKAEIKQVAGELYKLALDFMDDEEARDLFISITKRGRGKRGLGRNPVPNPSTATERKRLARMRWFKLELGRELTQDDLRTLEQSFRDRLSSITDL